MSKRPRPVGGSVRSAKKRKTGLKHNGGSRGKSAQLQLQMLENGVPDENCFGNSWFDLGICICSSDGDVYTSLNERISIGAKLVFENGDAANDIQLHTNPKKLEIVANGTLRFKVRIDTLSMYHDNKQLKIVFNANDAPRHIDSITTQPFRLVKHRLEITSHPEPTFYKDEGGRSNCLTIEMCLKDSAGMDVANRTIPLAAKLVYEDCTAVTSNTNILEVLTPNLELKKGTCTIDFRINEVSKNHGKRKFCLLIDCSSDDTVYNDISSCLSIPIMVYSKRTKSKNSSNRKSRTKTKTKSKANNPPKSNNSNNNKHHSKNGSHNNKIKDASDEELEDTDIANDGMHSNHNFSSHATRAKDKDSYPDQNGSAFTPHGLPTLPGMTSGHPSVKAGVLPRLNHVPPVGVERKTFKIKREVGNDGDEEGSNSGGIVGKMLGWCRMAEQVLKVMEWLPNGYEYDEKVNSIDYLRPLYRCSYCLRYRNATGYGSHEPWCQLQAALEEYNKVRRINTEYTAAMRDGDAPNNSNQFGPQQVTMGTMQDTDDAPPQMEPDNNAQNEAGSNANNNNNNENSSNNNSNNNNNNNNNNNDTNMSFASLPNINGTNAMSSVNSLAAGMTFNSTSFGPTASNGTGGFGLLPAAHQPMSSIASFGMGALGPSTSGMSALSNLPSFGANGANGSNSLLSPQNSMLMQTFPLPGLASPSFAHSGAGAFAPMAAATQNSSLRGLENGVNGTNGSNGTNSNDAVKKERNSRSADVTQQSQYGTSQLMRNGNGSDERRGSNHSNDSNDGNNNNGGNSSSNNVNGEGNDDSSNDNNNNSNSNNNNNSSSSSNLNGMNELNGMEELRLPSIFGRVDSVATRKGSFGFAALDKERNVLGFFNDDFSFTHADSSTSNIFGDYHDSRFGNADFLTRKDSTNDMTFYQDVKRVISGDLNGHVNGHLNG